MSDTWFISDTHFNHANILKFTDRGTGALIRPGFRDLDDMNEQMIQKWNAKVGQYDTVYHLGDVAFGRHEDYHKIMDRLMGKKKLILGNHDKFDMHHYTKHFKEVMVAKPFTQYSKPFIASHYPLYPQEVQMSKHNYVWNVHGHIHQNTLWNIISGLDWAHGIVSSPNKQYVNISVEVTDYAPVHIDDLLRMMHR